MRDFPVFTTENGVGSIVLKEIPYRGVAYVTIRDSAFPTDFLQECVEFCRMAGAEHVYASGHSILESYTLHTVVIRMSASWNSLPETDACLFPVTEATLSQWCEIYNRKMKNVDNAAYMSQKAAKEMLERGDGYYIHRDGNLLGIGIASDNRIDCVASVAKGAGREIVAVLSHALMSDQIILEVASTNSRAIALYEALGFIPVAEVSRWYKIL
jgi:hypothetical protein